MERFKESMSKLAINEKIGLMVAAVCTLAMIVVLLAFRDAIGKALPYVFILGAVESVAAAAFIWRKNKRQALIYGIAGAALCIAMCIMSFKAGL